MFTILHISDLHRSSGEPVDNDTLIAALLMDQDRYLGETPAIPKPSAIVVSGDVIQGVSLGTSNWEEQIKKQYAVASEFLNKLSEEFLGGDRSQLIIVPGNHDVCWNTAFKAMDRIPASEYPDDLRKALLLPDSLFRWSWKDLALYKVSRPEAYAQRMRAYWAFAEEFYRDVKLPKPIDGLKGYQLFEILNGRAIVAAFDSTVGNDCFSYSGDLGRGTAARCNLELRQIARAYDLQVAVWHHSIQGPPMREDYMDIASVHEMIGLGFRLGLHGHQHSAEVNPQLIHLSDVAEMAVVSAGSLCAGTGELPRGINRQYNLIVLDDSLTKACVHVRELSQGEQFTRKTNGAFPNGYADIKWTPRLNLAGQLTIAREANDRTSVLRAESMIARRDYPAAIDALANVELSIGSHARRLALKAMVEARAWSDIASRFGEPIGNDEVVTLITAHTNVSQFDRALELLRKHTDIDTATERNLKKEIEIKRMMRTTR